MRNKNNTFTSKRYKKLRYDFLPPMLEIIERPANPVGLFIIFLIILITISTIVWAYYFKLDIAVTAQGYVMPCQELVSVKSIDTGIINRVYVTDGEYVQKGDPIIGIEQSQLELQIKGLKSDSEVMRVQYEVYTALNEKVDVETIDTAIYGDNANIAKAILTENELYLCRLKEYDNEIKKDQEKTYARDSFVKERELEILQNLNTLKTKMRDTDSTIERLENQMQDGIIKAPSAGKISQLSYKQDGSVLAANEVICYIIAQDSVMQFQAYVPDRDVKDVHVGDSVNVKLSLYNDTDDEIVEGIITKISDVAIMVQNVGNCYLTDIEMEKTDGLIEHVGTAGTCDIIVGCRSVLDYFMEPFRKGLKNSMKEP